MEGAWAFVEIEAEEGGVMEEVASKWDGAEGDVGGVGEVLPLVIESVEVGGEGLEGFGLVAADGEDGPSLMGIEFAVLEVVDIEVVEAAVE